MSSSSPNESTASRLQRIGQRGAAGDVRFEDLAGDQQLFHQFEDPGSDVEEPPNAAAGADGGAAEPLEANCTDFEPDMDSDETKNCHGGGSSDSSNGGGGEPSNFSVII